MSGSEFRGGEFRFAGTKFRSLAQASGAGVAPIQFTLTSSCVEPAEFVFTDGLFINEGNNAFFLRIYMNNCPTEPSLFVKNPVVRDLSTSLQYFARLDLTAGDGNWQTVEVTGLSGLPDNVRRLIVGSASVTATKYRFDPQMGTVAVAGNTGASLVSQNISLPYAYPTGMPPHPSATVAGVVGGKRVTIAGMTVSVSGISVDVATTDSANFTNANAGNVRWRADFN